MHRFIIVDDSRATQSIIRRALASAGYDKEQVYTVSSAVEALELATSVRPDLVITDWHMPTMTGLELLVKLRQSCHDDVRVGMVTTETNEIRLAEARSHGVSFILHKPFRDEDLLENVQRALAEPRHVKPPSGASQPPSGEQIVELAAGMTHESPWQIESIPLASFENISGKVLLGVYSRADDHSAIGLGLMDFNLITLLGGVAAHVPTKDILQSIANNQAPNEVGPHAEHFLKLQAGLFDSKHRTVLSRASLVNVKLELLRKTLHHHRWGVAFSLSIPELASGSMALIRLS